MKKKENKTESSSQAMGEVPQRANSPHIVMLPTPGMGHLIPLIEFAKKLLEQNCFTITFLIPTDNSPLHLPQKTLLQSLPLDSVKTIFLPPVSFDDLPEDTKIETRISLSVIRSLPSLSKVLNELNQLRRVSAFVVDLFGSFTFDLAEELGIPSFVFYTCSAMTLSYSFHLLQLDASGKCEHRDLPETVGLPGCVPVHYSDLPDEIHDRNDEAYKMAVELSKKYYLAKGILINTFLDLEADTLEAFEQGRFSNIPPVYPIGPLTRPSSNIDNKPEFMKWLDEQPLRSTVFVSFGSGGTLSRIQLQELISGLERSDQRYLLVAKSSNEKARNAAYFTSNENEADARSEFLDPSPSRKGFILSQWCPQIEVLSHQAIGGFVTHCGWNSILESITHGVPLIAWPLFAEQKMNAVLLSEGLKVAFRVREEANGVVGSEQISKLARSLIEAKEGEELRNRIRNLKDSASQVLSQVGSSAKSLAKVYLQNEHHCPHNN
ncbi:hydroquinone glucosyltransferase-like [Primulina tabacum]|uniref:hydroquinone glucosyltransferase-like n=1 Tax=Primulina tabacum TaxID=48773 RepID=UPI003F59E9A8